MLICKIQIRFLSFYSLMSVAVGTDRSISMESEPKQRQRSPSPKVINKTISIKGMCLEYCLSQN